MQVVDPQQCGDYIMPVSMTDLQKKVTSAIVSSNFSEILSFFDGTEQSRSKNNDKLQKMMADLNLVATHPYLLLPHLQPSLNGKRAPLAIENMSGKFQTLIMLAKRFVNPEQHVAVVCEAGHTTDLVELVLADRGLNVTRYSSQPSTKLYKKDTQKRKGAMFHLVPSELKDLRQAVYAAFDTILLMDNKFDVNSPYGQGLRAQLRDPVRRRPLASVLRLVALNSAQHIGLFPNMKFEEQIAAAVVRKKQVGALPSVVKQFYMKDLSPLQPFINNCDGPFLLPASYAVKQVGHMDVELALYLDDEDQYQVDFANRKVGSIGSYKRNRGTDSDDDESGSDESKSQSTYGGMTGGTSSLDSVSIDSGDKMDNIFNPSSKRRRVEIESGAIEMCKELSVSNPLSFTMLVQLNDLLSEVREAHEETESHRKLASNREREIELLREQMQTLARKTVDLQTKCSKSENKAEKLRIRNEKIEHDLRDTEMWWDKFISELKILGSDDDRVAELTKRITTQEADIANLKTSISNEKSRASHLQSMANASSEYADQLTKERDLLIRENNELKSRIHDEPAVKELAMAQQLKAKSIEVKALKAELENLKDSIKVQLSQERVGGRIERRYGGRGGRGASRQASPHTSVAF